jgi:hypothetical protein
MSIIQGTAKSGGATGEFYDFPIENSVRFDGSSYLSRTVSNNNGSTYTFSVWLKRHYTTGGSVLTAGNVTGSIHYHYFSFGEEMSNTHYPDASGGMWLHSAAKFRDSSAWYHAVWVVDCTNSTTADRQKLYVNGERLTDFSTITFASSTSATAGYINSTYSENRIGRAPAGHSGYYAGYMANIQLIDGQALDASYFGETKQDIWIPKAYTGSYGTNGFHLDFADSSNIGNDVSGNNNDWTVN